MIYNKLFLTNHHGFKATQSTSTEMIQMMDSWIRGVDTGQLTGACLLDMSSAFDVVNHGLLLEKLAYYGFSEQIIMWIKSYLSGRRQCVSIGGCLSKFLDVDSGVPQGSILGPLLYTIFTNELPEVLFDDRKTSENEQK